MLILKVDKHITSYALKHRVKYIEKGQFFPSVFLKKSIAKKQGKKKNFRACTKMVHLMHKKPINV